MARLLGCHLSIGLQQIADHPSSSHNSGDVLWEKSKLRSTARNGALGLSKHEKVGPPPLYELSSGNSSLSAGASHDGCFHPHGPIGLQQADDAANRPQAARTPRKGDRAERFYRQHERIPGLERTSCHMPARCTASTWARPCAIGIFDDSEKPGISLYFLS